MKEGGWELKGMEKSEERERCEWDWTGVNRLGRRLKED